MTKIGDRTPALNRGASAEQTERRQKRHSASELPGVEWPDEDRL